VRIRGDGIIDIRRDTHGVRHVSASTEPDLYRGLGFCHARDRGLQMLITRVIGRGRAAEILADTDDMLRIDRFFRRLGLADDALAEVDRIDIALACYRRVLRRERCDPPPPPGAACSAIGPSRGRRPTRSFVRASPATSRSRNRKATSSGCSSRWCKPESLVPISMSSSPDYSPSSTKGC
jgi:hypothetical protein